MEGKKTIIETLRDKNEEERLKLQQRPSTQFIISETGKDNFKNSNLIDKRSNKNDKQLRLLSQQEIKRQPNHYGLMTDQNASRNKMLSCRAAIKRKSFKNTFFTSDQRQSNASTTSHRQTDTETGIQSGGVTPKHRRPVIQNADKGFSRFESLSENPIRHQNDQNRDYIPNGLQPLNFVVAQANNMNTYQTQEFERSLMSGQDTRRVVQLEQVKLENARKLAKIEQDRANKQASRSVNNSIIKDSQKIDSDQLLGTYKASNFGAFRSKWVSSRYETIRVFSREAQCRGCKLESIAQKVKNSEDILSAAARTSLQSRENIFFNRRKLNQQPFSTMSGYNRQSKEQQQPKQRRVNLRMNNIHAIQSTPLEGQSLLDINRMRHSINQSPQSLLVDGTLVGSKLQTSYLDKFDSNQKLGKVKSLQDDSPDRPQHSPDLIDVADHGQDKEEEKTMQVNPAPIRQQDELTPEEISEIDNAFKLPHDHQINFQNKGVAFSNQSSNTKMMQYQVGSKTRANEPDTAYIGHKNLSGEIFQSEVETSPKAIDSEENLSRPQRMPLLIPVGETAGSRHEQEQQSPSPSIKLKVDLEQVTSSNKRENEFDKGAVTEKMNKKSFAKISSPKNNKSQKTVTSQKEQSNIDLNSVESAFKSINQPNKSGDIVDKLLLSRQSPNVQAEQQLQSNAYHLQKAKNFYNASSLNNQININANSMIDTRNNGSNLLITGKGDDHQQTKGAPKVEVVLMSKTQQSEETTQVDMQQIDQILFSPNSNEGNLIGNEIKNVDEAQLNNMAAIPQKKTQKKFGQQIYIILKKYGVLEALDRIDLQQQQMDYQQKQAFDREMDMKFKKVMHKIFQKKRYYQSPNKNFPKITTSPLRANSMSDLDDLMTKKRDINGAFQSSKRSSKTTIKSRASSAKQVNINIQNRKLNVQKINVDNEVSIQGTPDRARLHSQASPHQYREKSFLTETIKNVDFVLPSTKYVNDYFQNNHTKKLTERQAQDTNRLKTLTKSDRIQFIQRQQQFQDRYSSLPDSPARWRKMRTKNLIMTITKQANQNSDEQIEESDEESIESRSFSSSSNETNVHNCSPTLKKQNHEVQTMINKLVQKGHDNQIKNDNKGEVDTAIQLDQNHQALRRLQSTLNQHVLVPKPDFLELNQDRLDHFIELNDMLGPIQIEVFGKNHQQNPLPFLFRLRGCEFGKTYILFIKPVTKDLKSQDLNLTLEYPFQVDQTWKTDNVNLEKSHQLKIVPQLPLPVPGVPIPDVTEFNIFGKIISKSGCDLVLHLICPEKERARNREQIAAMLQKMGGKTSNKKAKSKHAMARILKMTRTEVQEVEDELNNYLKTARPDWTPAEEVEHNKELPYHIQKNIDDIFLANDFNQLQDRKDRAYMKEITTIEVQQRKANLQKKQMKEWQSQLRKWDDYREKMRFSKEVLVKLQKNAMVSKRLIVYIVLTQLVDKLKVIFDMIQLRKKLALCSTTIAVRMFILLKRNHKRLGANSDIRNQKRYFHFLLPLLTTQRIATLQERAKKCFLETIKKAEMINGFESKCNNFFTRIIQVQRSFRLLVMKRTIRQKTILNGFNREKAFMMETVSKKLASNPGSHTKALQKLQKKLPMLQNDYIAQIVSDTIRFKQCQSLDKFLAVKILVQQFRIKFLQYLKRNKDYINRPLMGMVGKENMEILSMLSNYIEHSKVKIQRWEKIRESLEDRIEYMSEKIFASLGSKDFVPMLVKASTKIVNSKLDDLYPKQSPVKGSKKKKPAIVKLFPSLLEEQQKAIEIQKRIESNNMQVNTMRSIRANIAELPPPSSEEQKLHFNNILDEQEGPIELEKDKQDKIFNLCSRMVKAASNYEENEKSDSEDEEAWKDCDACFDMNTKKNSSVLSDRKSEGKDKKKKTNDQKQQNVTQKTIERCQKCMDTRAKRLDKKFERIVEFYDGQNFIVLFKLFNIARSDYELRDQIKENIEWTTLNPSKEEIVRMVIKAASDLA